MRGHAEVLSELRRQRRTAYPERVTLAESLVADADQLGDEPLMWDTRIALSEAYGGSVANHRIMVPFGWLLARSAEAPAWLDGRRNSSLLPRFAQLLDVLISQPGISRAQLEAVLAQMAQRFEAAGEGPEPVLMKTYELQVHLEGHPAADAAYRAWVTASRTIRSAGEGHTAFLRAEHLVALGRHDEAIAEVSGTLAGPATSELQPQAAIGLVLPSLLRSGRAGDAEHADQAAAYYRRGVGLTRGNAFQIAPYILVGARAGQLSHALDLFTGVLPRIDRGLRGPPLMRLAAAGARLMSGLEAAGYADHPVSVPGQPDRSVSELGATLTSAAILWAGSFDRRNGTSVVGTALAADFQAPELPRIRSGSSHLPPRSSALSESSRSPWGVHAGAAGSPSELLAQHQRIVQSGTYLEDMALFAHWVEEGRRTTAADQRLAAGRLDAALLEHLLDLDFRNGRPPGHHQDLTARAVNRLEGAGAGAEASLAQLVRAALMVDLAAAEGHVAEIEGRTDDDLLRAQAYFWAADVADVMCTLTGDTALRDRAAAWRDRCLTVLGPLDDGSPFTRRFLAARALMLDIGVHGPLDPPERREASMGRHLHALDLLGPGEAPALRCAALTHVGQLHVRDSQPAAAHEALTAAVLAGVQSEDVWMESVARQRFGQVLLLQERPEDGMAEIEQAVRLADSVPYRQAGAFARVGQAEALSRAGQLQPAVAVAEAGLHRIYTARLTSRTGSDDPGLTTGAGPTSPWQRRRQHQLQLNAVDLHRIAARARTNGGPGGPVAWHAHQALNSDDTWPAWVTSRSTFDPARDAQLRQWRVVLLIALAWAPAPNGAEESIRYYDQAIAEARAIRLDAWESEARRGRIARLKVSRGLDAALQAITEAEVELDRLEADDASSEAVRARGSWTVDGERQTLRELRTLLHDNANPRGTTYE